jgi:hypothetical protein
MTVQIVKRTIFGREKVKENLVELKVSNQQ